MEIDFAYGSGIAAGRWRSHKSRSKPIFNLKLLEPDRLAAQAELDLGKRGVAGSEFPTKGQQRFAYKGLPRGVHERDETELGRVAGYAHLR